MMHGEYHYELYRAGVRVHSSQRSNKLIAQTGNYALASLARNLYCTELTNYEEYDAFRGYSGLEPYYLVTIPMDYPSICPAQIPQWHMGLMTANAFHTYAPTPINECHNYTDIALNAQRVAWAPDDPVNGVIANLTPTRFLFTADSEVFGFFLASSATFGSGLPDPITGLISNPALILSVAGLGNSPSPTQGVTFSPRAGDELRVHYMVYF